MNKLEGLPEIVYKYRNWKNPKHQRMLTEKEIYFASIDEFNDPFDGTIPFRYKTEQLTEENIFLKYLEVTKEEHPTWEDEKIHAHCYEFQRRGLLMDDNYMDKQIESIKKSVKETFGIVSLADSSENFLMWSHYSLSHTGICFGFDTYLLFEQLEGAITKVKYQKEIPLFDLFEHPLEMFHKLICTKSLNWNYENEIRIHRSNFVKKPIVLASDTYKSITFGIKMEHSIKMKLLDIIANNLPDIEVFELHFDKILFKLKPLRIR